MAALGDIGKADSISPSSLGFSAFGRNATAANTIQVTGTAPFINVFLITQAGMLVDVTRSNGIGDATFYDFDPGIYTVQSARGDVWQATIVGGSVTVIQILAAFRTIGIAHLG